MFFRALSVCILYFTAFMISALVTYHLPNTINHGEESSNPSFVAMMGIFISLTFFLAGVVQGIAVTVVSFKRDKELK